MTGWEVLVRELALAEGWQLGGGGTGIFSPPAPTRLDRPGFLDAAYYAGQSIEPIFAISILDGSRRPIGLSANARRWNPARLELTYNLPQALVTERRTVLSSDAFVSQLSLAHAEESSRDFWFVMWTRRPMNSERTIAEIDANPQGLSFSEAVIDGSGHPSRWGWALGTNFDAESWTVDGTPYSGLELDWPRTPLADLMTTSGLPGHFPSEARDGWLWLALAYPFTVAPGDRIKISFVAAFASDVEGARSGLERAAALIDPIHASEEEWIAWFEDCPSFECSDPYLQRAYWHRWAQRRLWQRAKRPGDSPGLKVDASIETAWRHDTDEVASDARETLANWTTETQEPLGVYLRRLAGVHPTSGVLDDIGATGRVVEQAVQQMLTPSHASPRSLALALDLLGSAGINGEKADHFSQAGLNRDDVRARLMENCWCDVTGWFLQNQPGQPLEKTLEGAVPLLDSDLELDVRQRIEEKLLDPVFFGGGVALPGVSRDEAAFRPDVWSSANEGWRYGRVCPHLVSLAIEALGRGVESASHQTRTLVARLICDFVRLSFEEGDVNRPRSFDHYHPLGGRGSDYLGPAPPKGWLADHLIQFAAGLRPLSGGLLIVDPLPFGLEWFRLERVCIGDDELDIRWDNRSGLAVLADGRAIGQAPVGRSLVFEISRHHRDAFAA